MNTTLLRRRLASLALACVVAASPLAAAEPAAAAPAAQVVAEIGSTGATVRKIQALVGAHVDGQYGPRTAAAVTSWQRRHDLPGTGVVDRATWAKMRPLIPISSSPLTGADISWPQCPKGMGIPSRPTEGKPMPKASTKFVVLGVTNGPGFYPNPCLAKQVKWAEDHGVYAAPYAFTTYPTSSQLKKYGRSGPYRGGGTTTRLKNAGYAEAMFNVATMKKVRLSAPFIWVDVEPSRAPAPWSRRTTYNKAVLDGVLAGYRAAGLKVGFYTSESPWRSIIGTARYRLPEWRTVGPASKAAALKKCSARSVQGGKVVMAQWWVDDSPTSNSTDFDVLCPGYNTPAQLARYFINY